MKNEPVFRRPKSCPARDFWYTLKIGLVIFVLLIITLPALIG